MAARAGIAPSTRVGKSVLTVRRWRRRYAAKGVDRVVEGRDPPARAQAVFDQLFAIDDQLQALGRYDERLSNARSRLKGAIAATRQDIFVQVLAARAQTDNPRRIGLMADLLARHGGNAGEFEAANRSRTPCHFACHCRRLDSDTASGAEPGSPHFLRSRACRRTTGGCKLGGTFTPSLGA